MVSRAVVAVIHNEHYSVAGGLDTQLSAADFRTADQINDVSMQSHAAHCSQPRRINSITFTLYNKRARCTAQNGTTHAPCYWAECACALWRGVRGSASALAHFCGAVNLGVRFISGWIRVWWSLPRLCAFFSHLLFTSYEQLYEHWNKRLGPKILIHNQGIPPWTHWVQNPRLQTQTAASSSSAPYHHHQCHCT